MGLSVDMFDAMTAMVGWDCLWMCGWMGLSVDVFDAMTAVVGWGCLWMYLMQ